jgi:hypothetical protein
VLYWRFHSEACRNAGALPPEVIRLSQGCQDPASPFRHGDEIEVDRAIYRGYRARPSDCPAVRNISRYGYMVRCPGEVHIERQVDYARERDIRAGSARFGYAVLHGSPWPRSDSDLVASWITGSEYVKIQTGIDVLFPKECQLYQGPLPNPTLEAFPNLPVASGLEYYNRQRSVSIDGRVFGIANINIIVRLPPVGTTWYIAKGDPIAWIFELPRHADGLVALDPQMPIVNPGDA